MATRRPYDDPGVARVYYRLVPERETLLAKTHMPYLLSPARLAKFRGWFLDADYRVDALPSYDLEQASNPFISFAAIPPDSRYRFLLDEAEFFIMNFIKGPVCRGQVAVDVIEDHFWVFFIDPKQGADEWSAELLARQADNMRLPAADGSDARLLLGSWRKLAEREDRVLAAKTAQMNQRFGGARKVDLSLIWDGDGRNPNAALTVFRHFDNASVVKGLVGEPPKTAWVLGYPLFERIYYLLVAGYDPYGNLAHQLDSRLYMDFMRMEGESNFLMFLPKAARQPTRDHWYRGASAQVKSYVDGSRDSFSPETGIPFRSPDPQREFYDLLKRRLAPVLRPRFDLASVADAGLRAAAAEARRAARREPVVVARGGGAARRCGAERAAVLQPAAQHRPPQRVAPDARRGPAGAGREHADGGARLHRRLPERDLARHAGRAARTHGSARRAGVAGRLQPVRRPLRDPAHQRRLLARERCARRGLPAVVTAGGRACSTTTGSTTDEQAARVRCLRPGLSVGPASTQHAQSMKPKCLGSTSTISGKMMHSTSATSCTSTNGVMPL